MKAERMHLVLKPDPKRVIFLPFKPVHEEQIPKIVARVLSITEEEVNGEIEDVCKDFGERHNKICDFLPL